MTYCSWMKATKQRMSIQSCGKICCGSTFKKHRLLLTGTPLQNNLQELWSVFDCVQPGIFDSFQKFTKEYATPIEEGLTKDSTTVKKTKSKKLSEKLRAQYKPHFLRRTKKQIFTMRSVDLTGEALKDNELPLKTDLVIWVKLSESQKKLYQYIISQKHVQSVIAAGASRNAFCLLSVIKKLCQHPLLLRKGAMNKSEKDDDFFGEEEKNLADFAEEDTGPIPTKKVKPKKDKDIEKQTKMMELLDLKDILNDAVAHYNGNDVDGILADSSKLVFLFMLLENLHKEGHRVLIYSMSKVMLNIIEKITKAAGKFQYRRIDGDTDIEERDKIQKEFNKNSEIFMCFLTTKVGGCGLNLVGADRVIIFDPDWNPANDNQAVDRIYRIGQKKDIIVYRLITIHGIEERIYRRQIHKQGINKATVESKESKNIEKYFSNEDLFELFNLDKEDENCKTLEILKESEKKTGKVTNKNQSKKLKKHLNFLKKLETVFGVTNNALVHMDEDEKLDDDDIDIPDHYHYKSPRIINLKQKKIKKKKNVKPKEEDFEMQTRAQISTNKKKPTKKIFPPAQNTPEESFDIHTSDLNSLIISEDSVPKSALEDLKQKRRSRAGHAPILPKTPTKPPKSAQPKVAKGRKRLRKNV
ncbi:unnamed protein product [Moneuplotes crassus]|uniref:Helicase C-terminal domain-containing protein n=1 Tax=Euplotes crassus TaxID=5936 RepID=A0AAD1XT52_EUPCR|nr:unnamed protein product [Moneuplotes crassus]